MNSKDKINALRQKIDDFDDQMLDLLVQRFAISEEIGDIKATSGVNIGDPNREREIIDRLTEKLEGKLKRDDIAAIFGPVYHISKKLQIKEK
ncbi:chorismate mutase [Caldithrix abyssi]|nr:chorismate mutase [Caldithrix abyssi]